MQKLFRFRWAILAVFGIAILLSALALPRVGVNYDILSYLPKDSPSTIALNKMEEIFGSAVSEDTRIMVAVASMPEALLYKEQIQTVGEVSSVRWLDDETDIHQPETFIAQSLLDSWYKNGYALFVVSFADEATNADLLSAADDIRSIVGKDAAISGGRAGDAVTKRDSSNEVSLMMGILVPVVLIIMIIATSSWLEPLLFLAVIAISILINMGTNIFLGEISFVSQTTAAALQLAVSMDYSIFLIHSFTGQRKRGLVPIEAMNAAIKQSFPSIIASGITTLCGFLALTLMRFGIGMDLGIVLAKGVLISLVSVTFLLPVLTMMTYKPLEKFTHRSFMPNFKGFSKVVMKAGLPVVVLVGFITVPAFLGQSNNDFVYMASTGGTDSRTISEEFGKAEQMVLMVPEGNVFAEQALTDDLSKQTHITSILAYVTTVGMEIPFESLPKETRELLEMGGYTRMLLSVDTAQGAEEGFDLIEAVRQTAEQYYGDAYYLAGTGVSLYDMRDTVISDNVVTTIAAIIAISLIILLAFRSPPLLILLVGTIEISIWINLSLPYFMDKTITFFGFMIIGAVQLGATVDYAILYCSRYLEKRKAMGRLAASEQALSETAGSILTSAAILFGAGMIISTISTEEVTAELGNLLGRGAALSALMVLFFLPNVMRLCDKLIQKLTYRSNFFEEARK